MAFWHWGTLGADNYQPTFQQVSDQFMQHPRIKVENQMPSYWDKMVVALASDTPPDVYLINSVRARQWFNQGTTRDVTPYITKDKVAAREPQRGNQGLHGLLHGRGQADRHPLELLHHRHGVQPGAPQGGGADPAGPARRAVGLERGPGLRPEANQEGRQPARWGC